MPTFNLDPSVDEHAQRAQPLVGRGGPGSARRQISWSIVGTENVTASDARDASRASTSTSRMIIGPRVMIRTGFACSASTSRHARVSL